MTIDLWFPMAIALLVFLLFVVTSRMVVNVGGAQVGIMERRYLGRPLPEARVVALREEIGFQARSLQPGLHFLGPYLFKVTRQLMRERFVRTRMPMNIMIGLAGLLLLSLSAQAQGIRLSEKRTVKGQTTVTDYAIDKTHLRIEESSGQWVIFDATKSAIYQINSNKKTYAVLTQALLAQMQRATIERVLTTVPPDQREALEQSLKGPTPIPSSILSYRKTGTDKVRGWTCTKYEWGPPLPKSDANVRISGPRTEVCVVPAESLGLSAADFAIMNAYERFQLGSLPRSSSSGTPDIGIYVDGVADGQAFSGIAVRRIVPVRLGDESTTEIVRLRREAVPAATFEVPAGLNEQSLQDFLRP